MKLAPFQEVGRDFLAARKVALLADQMRLGKSAQVIRAADKLKAKKILVVCPASIKIVWQREFLKWQEIPRSIQIVSGILADLDPNVDVVIINYDIVWRPGIKEQLINRHFAVAAIDESHYLSGRKAKRTVAMLSSKDRTPILASCVYKWFTTGTPITSRPKELYPILASCAPEVISPYSSYKAYTRHFCGGYWDGVQWVDKGATNKEELNERLHNGFMLRRLRKDYLNELPPVYNLVPISVQGETLKTKVAQEFAWERDAANYQKLEEAEHIATLRRELGQYKVPEAVKYIKHILTMEDKLVVFAYHRSVMDALYEALQDYGAVKLMGGMSVEKKQVSIDTFKDDPTCRVFIGQVTAAGMGIDLSSSHNILFVESSWVPGEIDQAADRCSGYNQSEKVNVQFMVIQDSLEEHMLRTVIDKKQKIESIVEQSDIFN